MIRHPVRAINEAVDTKHYGAAITILVIVNVYECHKRDVSTVIHIDLGAQDKKG